MESIIAIVVVGIIVAAAIGYIVKEKKKGTKCIGCSSCKECAKRSGHCH